MDGDLQATLDRLANLSGAQLRLLGEIIDTFKQPIAVEGHSASDLASEEFIVAFGDMLKLHHSLSRDYLDKHRFEAAMEKVLTALGRTAARPASRCHPGHDITVDGVAWSLKTQGDKGIRRETLYISKFMELGKGRWRIVADLAGLRDQFLEHMLGYDRIFQLRYFRLAAESAGPPSHRYELVEIPKAILNQAARGRLSMMRTSKQSPKPGYCDVPDEQGMMFRLYFDGGTERKLQIKDLRKNLCMVHATWEF